MHLANFKKCFYNQIVKCVHYNNGNCAPYLNYVFAKEFPLCEKSPYTEEELKELNEDLWMEQLGGEFLNATNK